MSTLTPPNVQELAINKLNEEMSAAMTTTAENSNMKQGRSQEFRGEGGLTTSYFIYNGSKNRGHILPTPYSKNFRGGLSPLLAIRAYMKIIIKIRKTMGNFGLILNVEMLKNL